MLQKFRITEDFKQQYSDIKDGERIEQYAEEIKQYKRTKNDSLHINDAKNMIWVELARNNCDNNVRDTKFYFVTSDRRLQEWDLHHSKNQPITMLPSQWLALLLKYFSQSNDDYKSFVSFLTMPNEKAEVTPDELQDILAGISEITEDFQKQNDIVSQLLESNNSRELRNHVEAQKFAQSCLETQLKEKLEAAEKENQKKLETQQAISQELLSKQKEEFEKMLDTIRQERQKDKLERLKEKKGLCESQLKDKENILQQINSIADRKKNNLKALIVFIYIAYIIGISFLIYRIGWEDMEPITYITGMVMVAIPFICSLVMNRSLDCRTVISEFRDRCYKKQCIKYDFFDSEISDLKETIESLNSQITDLKNSIGK